MIPLPALQAPVWERQPNESEVEHRAFVAWLCGGRELKDWTAATHASGLDPSLVRSASVRWVWEVRAGEWLRHSRDVAMANGADVRDAVKQLTATRVQYAQNSADLIALEVSKHLARAKATEAVTLEPRELARFMAVAEALNENLRRQSEGLPSEVGATTLDWGRLTPQELEQARKLRAKAEGRVA